MNKETLKDWIKKWSLELIVDNVFSYGMEYMARGNKTDKEISDYKKIIVKELKSRIKAQLSKKGYV